MFGLPVQFILVGLAALAIVAGIEGWSRSLKESGREECRAEHVEAARMAELRARERGDTAAGKYEASRAQRQQRERVVTQEVERIVERPVYRDRCVDDDGLRLIRDRIAERPGAGEPAPAVPAASKPE